MAIWISRTASIAILFAGAACMMIAPSASAQAKDAEPATRQANAEVLRSLPFADRTDFADAQRGFIASLPDGLVLGDGQRVVWSMKPYAFQQNAAAPAENAPGYCVAVTELRVALQPAVTASFDFRCAAIRSAEVHQTGRRC